MQKLTYNKRVRAMICDDIGEIIKINRFSNDNWGYSAIESVTAKNEHGKNGMIEIFCDTKVPHVKAQGYCRMDWFYKKNAEIKYFPVDMDDGYTIELNPKIHYQSHPSIENKNPRQLENYFVCSDPRLLYFLTTTYFWNRDNEIEVIKRYNERIPTKEEALEYLIKNKFQHKPMSNENGEMIKFYDDNFDYFCQRCDE